MNATEFKKYKINALESALACYSDRKRPSFSLTNTKRTQSHLNLVLVLDAKEVVEMELSNVRHAITRQDKELANLPYHEIIKYQKLLKNIHDNQARYQDLKAML